MSSHRYAVFGHPVAHSLSPRIHAAFAQQTGIALEYTAIDAAPHGFVAALDRFADDGGAGANVTLPLKEAAFAICTQTTDRARRAGAVNTLTRNEGQWHGDNTDGAGLVRDLTGRHGLDLRARRALLLGAGGAARGVAPALLDAGISELIIVNRTAERADALADALGEPERAHSRYWQDLGDLGDFSLIVNATSASRQDQGAFTLPFHLATPRTLAVDLNYGEAAIPFLAWARAAGCHDAVDGLGMLVEQAAEAFEHWHGVRPDTDPVYAALRDRDKVLVTAD
ncbi:shikimate dehydrogenase [Pseudoxanthomonas sp. F37]|jgi:shikimate dehydrogenase|uniref:shikimate dehydrogenase n=1 Tax=Pseudoxanthomonas TaxID=83618 RepID=UPI001FD30FE9|nr:MULTISPECIES: shikimate dehydrogenase [Pseudoxanthomonas]UOV04031.1 shikimate dehydrogenase [Pseudoxanthomonas mexicana]UOV09031.1 shikimate dehydrogenase [Pseudoxanthomonas sp. F37]